RKMVARFRGFDHGEGGLSPGVPVIIIRQESATIVPAAEELPEASEVSEALPLGEEVDEDEFMPTFEDIVLTAPTTVPGTEVLPPQPLWPSLAWEKNLLKTLEQPGLPRLLAEFSEGGYDYLIEEVPTGQSLWDAWDDPDAPSDLRFGYLVQVAEILHSLHTFKCILEGMRPDHVIVMPEGQIRICDLSDLLPLPIPT